MNDGGKQNIVVEEGQKETTSDGKETSNLMEKLLVQKEDKGTQKRITPTLVDKGARNVSAKDKGKKPMGTND